MPSELESQERNGQDTEGPDSTRNHMNFACVTVSTVGLPESILGEPSKVEIDKFSFGRGSKQKLGVCLGSILRLSPYILLLARRVLEREIVCLGGQCTPFAEIWNEVQGTLRLSGFGIEYTKNYCRHGIHFT